MTGINARPRRRRGHRPEGKRAALKFAADAPICLIQAPAGRYRVEAAVGGEKRTVATTVAKNGKRPGTLVFRFPAAE